MTLAGRRVVLGVSGGIACYKACSVARRLTEAGVRVDVILTAAATEFVRPLVFEALTGRRVLESLWQGGAALDHIALGRKADLIVVAPATANLIARAAQGLADDVLSATLLAGSAPVLLAPAMNDSMFAHPMTQENLARLRARGWQTIGPAIGALAEGPSERPGRMSEPDDIVAAAVRMVRGAVGKWRGKRVVVTAGPTREELDPVRVLTNRSSGRMGYALAEAAYSRGADVVLIRGATPLPPPRGFEIVTVETTADMMAAVARQLPDTDVLVMAAAPADFKPLQTSQEKYPRRNGSWQIQVEPTDDILVSTRELRRPGALVIGFALETTNGIDRAKTKLDHKGLDLIVYNSTRHAGAGFETTTNAVTIIGPDQSIEVPLASKREVSERILDAVEQLM